MLACKSCEGGAKGGSEWPDGGSEWPDTGILLFLVLLVFSEWPDTGLLLFLVLSVFSCLSLVLTEDVGLDCWPVTGLLLIPDLVGSLPYWLFTELF